MSRTLAFRTIDNNEYNTSDNIVSNKSTEVIAMDQNSPQNYYQTLNTTDYHSVPKMNATVVDNNSNNSTEEFFTDIEKSKMKINAKIDDYCMKIIRDMNTLGVCLIDNFMQDFGRIYSPRSRISLPNGLSKQYFPH